MIPLRDQDVIRQRFQTEMPSRVRIDYFTQRKSQLYIPGRQECPLCQETKALLEEIAHLGDRVSLTVHELSESREAASELAVDKVPGIVIRGQANRPVRFFGIPSGSQFPDFIETIIDASRGAVDLKPETVKVLRKVKSPVWVQVFVTPTCPYSPALARNAHRLGLQNPKVKADVVEVGEFPQLMQRYGIRAVPTTVIDDKVIIPGGMDEASLMQAISRVVEGRPVSAGSGPPGPMTPLQEEAPTPGSGLVLPR